MDEVLDIIEENFRDIIRNRETDRFQPTAPFLNGWTLGAIDAMLDLLEKWVAKLEANGMARAFSAQVSRAHRLIALMKEVKT